jgi:hypothetical protein
MCFLPPYPGNFCNFVKQCDHHLSENINVPFPVALFNIIILLDIKMADIEGRSDLRSNLFHQSGFISSVNECLCCIDLNSKLKSALDEISSLNLIIKFLLNELMSDCALASSDIVLSTLCKNSDKKEEHEVSIHKNWIEVTSKHRCNPNNFRNPVSVLANQPILTSNRYAQLINLQDSIESVNNTIVPSDRGLLSVSQRVDWQMEAINKETNCIHHVPVILHGKIYSNVANN